MESAVVQEIRTDVEPAIGSPAALSTAKDIVQKKLDNKRIQSRVAQRTYRNRTKDKVRALEQQLTDMQSQQSHMQNTERYSFYTANAVNTPMLDQTGSETTPQFYYTSQPTANADNSYNRSPYITHSSSLPTTFYNTEAVLDETVLGDIPHQVFSPSNAATSLHIRAPRMRYEPPRMESYPEIAGIKRDADFGAPGFPTESYLQNTPYSSASSSNRREKGLAPPFTNKQYHASPAFRVSDISGISNGAAPSRWAAVEERFQYVIECARRVGFSSFDAMATQYYTQDFNMQAPISMDQRVSRNRQLPSMLVGLRRGSATWSAWERHGFHVETLKTAEEICAAECQKFSLTGESLTLENVKKQLPKVWAFLTGLTTASASADSIDKTAEIVFAVIKQLCVIREKKA